MVEGARYLFIAEFARQTPMAVVSGCVLEAGQVGQPRKLTLDSGARPRSLVADLIDHKNYKYVIRKTDSRITQKSRKGKTISVHIVKEVWHGEKTRFLGSNSSPHSPNLATAV